jgi:hypothetical protein
MKPQPIPEWCRLDIYQNIQIWLRDVVSSLLGGDELVNVCHSCVVLIIFSVLEMCSQVSSLDNFSRELG